MTQPEPPASVEAIFGDPALVRIYRGALALSQLRGATPTADGQLAPLRTLFSSAVFDPELLSLRDRLVLAGCLHEVGRERGDPELSALGLAVADDALDIAVSHAAEAATLLSDAPAVERTRRFLELLINRVTVSPPPGAVPSDPAVAAQLYGPVREILAPWRASSTPREG